MKTSTRRSFFRQLKSIGIAVISVAAAALALETLEDVLSDTEVVLVLVAVVCWVATVTSRAPAAFAAVASVLFYDFLFVEPRYTLNVADHRTIVTFVVLGIVGLVVASLTERVRVQSERARRREVWLEKERTRTALLGSVSHDLRTPVGTILGSATALLDRREQLSEGEQRQLLESVRSQAERLGRILKNLHDLTRLEGGAEPRPTWVATEEIMAGARDLVTNSDSVRLIVEQGAEMLFVDELFAQQALANLIENALRHGAAPVEVRVRVEDDHWQISVSDSGLGIPDGEREAVFEKFTRGEHAARGSGAGVGLAIVQAVARLHAGRAWARGTRVGFDWPARRLPDAAL